MICEKCGSRMPQSQYDKHKGSKKCSKLAKQKAEAAAKAKGE